MVAMGEPEEHVEAGPCASRRKTAARPFVLSKCTSWARPPLLDCSLRPSSAVQLSGKVHEDSDHHCDCCRVLALTLVVIQADVNIFVFPLI